MNNNDERDYMEEQYNLAEYQEEDWDYDIPDDYRDTVMDEDYEWYTR
jgi:hypothetical protein